MQKFSYNSNRRQPQRATSEMANQRRKRKAQRCDQQDNQSNTQQGPQPSSQHQQHEEQQENQQNVEQDSHHDRVHIRLTQSSLQKLYDWCRDTTDLLTYIILARLLLPLIWLCIALVDLLIQMLLLPHICTLVCLEWYYQFYRELDMLLLYTYLMTLIPPSPPFTAPSNTDIAEVITKTKIYMSKVWGKIHVFYFPAMIMTAIIGILCAILTSILLMGGGYLSAVYWWLNRYCPEMPALRA